LADGTGGSTVKAATIRLRDRIEVSQRRIAIGVLAWCGVTTALYAVGARDAANAVGFVMAVG
jgi:hypothetical protein